MYRKSIYAWKQTFDIVYFMKSNFDIGFHVLQRLLKEIIRRSDTHNYWIISCEELNISCSFNIRKFFCLPFRFGNDFRICFRYHPIWQSNDVLCLNWIWIRWLKVQIRSHSNTRWKLKSLFVSSYFISISISTNNLNHIYMLTFWSFSLSVGVETPTFE